jgi:hypothetical protein
MGTSLGYGNSMVLGKGKSIKGSRAVEAFPSMILYPPYPLLKSVFAYSPSLPNFPIPMLFLRLFRVPESPSSLILCSSFSVFLYVFLIAFSAVLVVVFPMFFDPFDSSIHYFLFVLFMVPLLLKLSHAGVFVGHEEGIP